MADFQARGKKRSALDDGTSIPSPPPRKKTAQAGRRTGDAQTRRPRKGFEEPEPRPHEDDRLDPSNPAPESGNWPDATTTSGSSESDVPHDAIRSSIAQWFKNTSPALASIAADLALSIHPWPARDLTEEQRDAVVSNLLPWSNLPHPDLRQVAADRLLRLSEVFRSDSSTLSSALEFEGAAERLIEASYLPINPSDQSVGDVVIDPTGICMPATRRRSDAGTDPAANAAWQVIETNMTAATCVARAVLSTGSLDLGRVMGQDDAGVSVVDLMRLTGYPKILAGFDAFFSSLDERQQDVLSSRSFKRSDPATLEEVGERWDRTRELVRQLEVKTLNAIRASYADNFAAAGEILEPAKESVTRSPQFEALERLIRALFENGDVVAGAVRRFSGPWIDQEGWTYHKTMSARLEARRQRVLSRADTYGILPDDAVHELNGLFASDRDQLRYFQSAMGLAQIGGFWATRDNLRSRAAIGLRILGRPATKDEIRDAAGLSEDTQVGSTLSVLPGIVRADQKRWAFAEWVDDVYESIPAEIRQRIDRAGGSLAVALLLDELPRKFGVSEASVSGYLASAAFVIEEGYARRANPGDFTGSDPSKWPDAVCEDGLWGQRMRVEDRHFRGYSLRVRFDIAFANGIRPESSVSVPIEDTDELASVIFRLADANSFIDVGRVRDALAELGIRSGDEIIVFPNPDSVRIVTADVGKAGGPARVRAPGTPDAGAERQADHPDPLLDMLAGT